MKSTLILFLASGLLFGQASPTNPTLPTSIPPSTRPTPTGSVIAVHSGDDLQAKYNAASCGDDLVIDDGVTFTGSYTFNKQCSSPNWVLVEGTGCANGTTPIPTYVTAANINSASVPPIAPPSLTHYATINSSTSVVPLVTTDGSNVPAKYNYFGCIEITTSVFQFFLVGLTNSGTETLTSQLGDHIIFDRVYVHGVHGSSTIKAAHGFYVNGGNISIVNSYVSEIYDSESQAILMSAGPGPYYYHNNFLSAASEIIMAGGTGQTPGYHCTVAASPAPTTTTATVNTCIDLASGAVATPPIGTEVMFWTSNGASPYNPQDHTTITGNTAGALTFTAIPEAPVSGAGHIGWGIVPSDITVTRNFFYKLPSWNSSDPSYDGISRFVKNFIESKAGQRWNIDGNVFINSWNGGQQYAFNFNSTDQAGTCPWCFSSDISLTNNVVKNISADFVIIGTQNGGGSGGCPPFLARVLIKNNLFFAAGAAPFISHSGTLFALSDNNGGCTYLGSPQGADSLQIVHNDFLGEGYNGQISDGWPLNFSNFVIKDNITQFDSVGWFLGSGGCPIPCLTTGSTSSGTWTVSNNAIINSGPTNATGLTDAQITSTYTTLVLHTYYDTSVASGYSGAPFTNYSAVNTDYTNWALTGAGGWRNAASDGTDVGINLGALNAALLGGSGQISGKVSISGKVVVH